MKRVLVLGAGALLPLAVMCAVLLAYHLSGSTLFGLAVWPSGEARNWLDILQRGPGDTAAHLLWALDGRNPLSPWWYIAARPVFDRFPQAFLFGQIAASGLLALSTTALVYELSERKNIVLAIATGALAGLFVGHVRFDGIHWNFVGATAVSLLSVWTYAWFALRGRRHALLYGLSICLWLLAIGTYTIQAGAVLAVFALALTIPAKNLPDRISRAFLDTAPYVVVFLLFLLIWKTSEPKGISATPLNFSLDGLIASLWQGVWQDGYPILIAWARSIGPLHIAIFGGLPAIALALTIWLSTPSEQPDRSETLLTLGRLTLVALAVVAPTVVLESSGTTWGPGTRWPMVLQFWAPVLFVLLWTSLSLAIPLRLRRGVWLAGVAAFAVFSGSTFAGMNLNQVYIARADRAYFAALKGYIDADIVSGKDFPRQYIVRLEPNVSAPSDYVSGPYVRTVFQGYPQVSYSNLLPGGIGLPVNVADNLVTTSSNGGELSTPVESTMFLKWDGTAMLPLEGKPSEFDGYAISWN